MRQDPECAQEIEIDALLTVLHGVGFVVGVQTPFIDSVLDLTHRRK